jgi:hypothetical protein
MVEGAEQCMKLPDTNIHAIYINFLANGYQPFHIYNCSVISEYCIHCRDYINSQDMVRLSSQPRHKFLFVLRRVSNTPDFDKINGL